MSSAARSIRLPEPHHDGGPSLQAALRKRRSIRRFSDEALSLEQAALLLWAAQGVTHGDGLRTAPSAGALYPLDVRLAVARVGGLAAGLYRYRPTTHCLDPVEAGDVLAALTAAALGQPCIAESAAVLAFSAQMARTTAKYGERGERYVCIEAGHAAQNVFLQAAALDLGAVVVGAFDDAAVEQVMEMRDGERALYLMPVGRSLRHAHVREAPPPLWP